MDASHIQAHRYGWSWGGIVVEDAIRIGLLKDPCLEPALFHLETLDLNAFEHRIRIGLCHAPPVKCSLHQADCPGLFDAPLNLMKVAGGFANNTSRCALLRAGVSSPQQPFDRLGRDLRG